MRDVNFTKRLSKSHLGVSKLEQMFDHLKKLWQTNKIFKILAENPLDNNNLIDNKNLP